MRKLLTVLMVCAIASVASAATVQLWVEQGGGTYAVKARVKADANWDNQDGIALLNVTLANAATINNQLPVAQVGTINTAAMAMFRSLADVNPVGAAQDTIQSLGASSPAVVYRLGMDTVDMTGLGTSYVPGAVIPREMLVATGTDASVVSITDATATVLTSIEDPTLDTYMADVEIIPEPATLGLLAMGALALIRRRK